ncbi:MAG: hypothetical protein GW809_07875 [Bacteroidetes bacterium]|nr:hypothetical protein [Bacteroidota bacterium]NCQ12041.1 hypothetical protein [Bacteroidota bacterium]
MSAQFIEDCSISDLPNVLFLKLISENQQMYVFLVAGYASVPRRCSWWTKRSKLIFLFRRRFKNKILAPYYGMLIKRSGTIGDKNVERA